MTEQPLGSNYVLTDKLGSGALGTVYRGRDLEGYESAIKVLRSDLAEDPGVVEQFGRAHAELVAADGPFITRIHDVVRQDSNLAIVMDLVEGGDLRAWLNHAGTLPPSEVARVGSQIAQGLEGIHRTGLAHGDVKPENILLDMSSGAPVPFVSDFAIAHLAASPRSNTMSGTANYMAPEIGEGRAPTPAADAYALGIVLYEMCCGVTPFEGGGPMAVMQRHSAALAARPEGIPDPLWRAIGSLWGKRPSQRNTVGSVAQVLAGMVGELQGTPPAPMLQTPLPPIPIRQSTGPARTQAVHTRTVRTAPPPVTKSNDSWVGWVVGLAVIALLVVGGWFAIPALLDAVDSGDSEPSETETSEPAETTDPAEPTEPDEPAQPVEPADPIETVDPEPPADQEQSTQ
ncbi:protein kinase [Ornithinimicrobium sp. Arc0846-15]|nr:protein kinase [Ornithinimicrobium laminariae]